MNIVVCIKQVPGTTEIKIDPDTNTLVREGIPGVINPFDCYALEEAVRLRERCGGKVTVISMGPPQAEEELREAISLGADEYHLIIDASIVTTEVDDDHVHRDLAREPVPIAVDEDGPWSR